MDSPKSNTYAKYVSKEVAYQSLIARVLYYCDQRYVRPRNGSNRFRRRHLKIDGSSRRQGALALCVIALASPRLPKYNPTGP